MGRPLNKKYFGNTNPPDYGIGGEAVASVTVGGTNNNYTAFPTVAFAAPTLPSGVQATGTVRAGVATFTFTGGTGDYAEDETLTLIGGTGVAATFNVDTVDVDGIITGLSLVSAGDYSAFATLTGLLLSGSVAGTGATVDVTALKINSIVMTENGSGYTTAPAVTDTPDGNATLTAVLSAAKTNAITMTGRVVAGSTVALDVIKQTGARRYLVTDGTNTGVVELVSTAVDAAGEANIVATDSASGTYYVTKLTAHRAVVTPGTGTQFSAGDSVPWVLDTAVENVSVKIPNA